MDYFFTNLSIKHWPEIDPYRDRKLGVGEAAPFLQELLRLLAAGYNEEKYAFLGTCGRLPQDKLMRERLVEKMIESRLASQPNYLATKEVVEVFEAQQEIGGTVLVSGD